MSSCTFACLEQVKEKFITISVRAKKTNDLLPLINIRCYNSKRKRKRKRKIINDSFSVVDQTRSRWTKNMKCHTVCFIHKYDFYLTKTSRKINLSFIMYIYIYMFMFVYRMRFNRLALGEEKFCTENTSIR